MSIFRARYFPFFLLAWFVPAFTGDFVRALQQPPATAQQPSATFEGLSAKATVAREAGNIEEAIRCYRAAIELRPDWAEGWWYLGTLSYDTNRYTDAIPALQSLVALSPNMAPALGLLGLSEFETKDYTHALGHLQQAQKLGYGDDLQLAKVARYHLALLLNQAGEFDESMKVLAPDLGRRRASDQLVVVLGMSLLRVPLLPGEVDPGKDALIHSAGEAAALMLDGKATQAAEALRKLSAENPKTPYLHYAQAMALVAAHEDDAALLQLAEEAGVTPGSALPFLRMAALHSQLGHRKEALAAAQKAVELDQQSTAAHEALAEALRGAGKIVDAALESEIAAKRQPGLHEERRDQQQLYANRITTEKRSSAPDRSTPISEQHSDSQAAFDGLVQKASAAQANREAETATQYLRQALALRPEWEEGWRNLGTLYFAGAKYGDAVAAFRNSAAIYPGNGNVWVLLGLAEFEAAEYKNSLIHLERGRNLGIAGNPIAVQAAKSHLALLLNRNGEFDRATELLTSETGPGAAGDSVKFALGLALLRIPLLPTEVDRSRSALIRTAGETAALLAESKYDQAFSKFEQMVALAPATPYLHYAYGSALASASRYAEADEQLVEETKITPESALPYLRRSSIALQLRHVEDASRLAQRAIDLSPESAEGHCLLGRAWVEMGKIPDAIQQLEDARELAPNSPEVHFALARAYAKGGRADAAESERAVFERLNADVQRQRSLRGSQAYGAMQNQNGIQVAEQPSSK